MFFTSPANNATFSAPASIALQANATALDDGTTVTRLEFLNGSTVLANIPNNGTDQFNFTWNNVTAGTYSLVAKAYDNRGLTKSVSKTITVTSAPNQPPTITLTAPSNGASFAAPATVNFSASASDSDGTISKVEFYNGAQLLATDTS